MQSSVGARSSHPNLSRIPVDALPISHRIMVCPTPLRLVIHATV